MKEVQELGTFLWRKTGIVYDARESSQFESSFATVRLRTTTATRFKMGENATALIEKIVQMAESTFRRLKGTELLPAVYAGVQYADGVQRSTSTLQIAA